MPCVVYSATVLYRVYGFDSGEAMQSSLIWCSPEDEQFVINLHSRGSTDRQIVEELWRQRGIRYHRGSIRRWRNKNGIPANVAPRQHFATEASIQLGTRLHREGRNDFEIAEIMTAEEGIPYNRENVRHWRRKNGLQSPNGRGARRRGKRKIFIRRDAMGRYATREEAYRGSKYYGTGDAIGL